jgi:hypothetical protein
MSYLLGKVVNSSVPWARMANTTLTGSRPSFEYGDTAAWVKTKGVNVPYKYLVGTDDQYHRELEEMGLPVKQWERLKKDLKDERYNLHLNSTGGRKKRKRIRRTKKK